MKSAAQNIIAHPAHILIGNSNHIKTWAIKILQHILCPQAPCTACYCCKNIEQQIHPNLLWLVPEKNWYTRDEFEVVFRKATFQLNDNEHFFFVIEKSHQLHAASANSLLKLLEEPPRNYHFLLLTDYLDALMPTIQSRCLLHAIDGTSTPPDHPLLKYFVAFNFQEVHSFTKYIESQNLPEYEHRELLQELQKHVLHKYLKNNAAESQQSNKLLSYINRQITLTLTPGSSKLLWKNMYLQFLLHHIST